MIQELREYSNSIFFKILLGIIAITFVCLLVLGDFLETARKLLLC
ncbi:MAG: hypothetical protein CM1200mP28_11110 [Deltaproteobacteria bacterium]|nr:MAG: hypothetical protein CM1200mP28_11110 [Deltaproteobacteria bacterium]